MARNSATSAEKGLKHYLPIVIWLPNYRRGWLSADLVAAVTVLTILTALFLTQLF